MQSVDVNVFDNQSRLFDLLVIVLDGVVPLDDGYHGHDGGGDDSYVFPIEEVADDEGQGEVNQS